LEGSTRRRTGNPPPNRTRDDTTDVRHGKDRLKGSAIGDEYTNVDSGNDKAENESVEYVSGVKTPSDPEATEQAEHEARDWTDPVPEAFCVGLSCILLEGPNSATSMTSMSTAKTSAATAVKTIRFTRLFIATVLSNDGPPGGLTTVELTRRAQRGRVERFVGTQHRHHIRNTSTGHHVPRLA